MKAFDPKNFSSSPSIPSNLFGPVGRGDDGEKFYKLFQAKEHPKNITVVAPKNQKTGSFSLMRIGSTYDIAFYVSSTGKEVWDAVTNGTAGDLDPQYFRSNTMYKYLYMDLVDILKEFGLW